MRKYLLAFLIILMFALPSLATVETTTFSVQYTASGSGVTYPFSFPAMTSTDIYVSDKAIATGTTTVLSAGTYSVSCTNNNCENGGTVTTVATYPAGDIITVYRQTAITQSTQFYSGMPALYPVFEKCLDRLTMISQEVTVSSGGSGSTLAGDVTGTLLNNTVGKIDGVLLPAIVGQTGLLYDSAGTLSLQTTLPTAAMPALTGDVTNTAGSLSTSVGNLSHVTNGSLASTGLAATAVTAGSYGSSTSIPNITVNAEGQITAAGGNAVIAPAGTLSGTTLASNVVGSSLTSAAGGSFGTGAFVNTGVVAGTVPVLTTGGALPSAVTVPASQVTGTLPAAQYAVFGPSGPTHAQGAVPDPGSTIAVSRYLREDGTWNTPSGSGNVSYVGSPVAGQYAVFTGNSTITGNPLSSPTIQQFTSGSATYYLPVGCLWIRVRMVGGGGGGGGSGYGSPGTGGAGGNTTFGTTLLVANGGSGGVGSGEGGAGGTASLGSGPNGTALTGGRGMYGTASSAGSAIVLIAAGGAGASSPLGGAGRAGQGVGGAGQVNTGSGGGGAGNTLNLAQTVYTGGGGGAGGWVDAIITSPAASYGYAVGAAGTAGSAGTSGNAGGLGALGYIVVEEHYAP
jgi:hypothetical protein